MENKILELLGGYENIQQITHCATRLRPTVKDVDRVDVVGLKELKGIVGVISKGNEFQLIIGTHVDEVYDSIQLIIDSELSNEKSRGNSKESSISIDGFISMVVAIFSPLLPLLAGSGLIRGFTILANEFGVLNVDSTTSTLLELLATSVFYFLPIMVAFTASKRFKTNSFIAVAIIGTLIMPGFLDLKETFGSNITYFGMTVSINGYTGQVIMPIITVYIQSVLEKFLKDKMPNSLHLAIVPTILMFVIFPIAALVVGPLANSLSIGLAKFVSYLGSLNRIITGAVVGGIWNILIMFGVHWAPNTMVIIPEIAQTGTSPYIAYGANANFGMAGAALAVFFLTKDKELKNFSISSIISVFLSGIVEPALYGIGVKFKSPLVAGCLGAALGGAFMGAFNVVGNAFVFGGLTTIPAFAGPTLWAYILGVIIAFVGGFIFTYLFGIKENQ